MATDKSSETLPDPVSLASDVSQGPPSPPVTHVPEISCPPQATPAPPAESGDENVQPVSRLQNQKI